MRNKFVYLLLLSAFLIAGNTKGGQGDKSPPGHQIEQCFMPALNSAFVALTNPLMLTEMTSCVSVAADAKASFRGSPIAAAIIPAEQEVAECTGCNHSCHAMAATGDVLKLVTAHNEGHLIRCRSASLIASSASCPISNSDVMNLTLHRMKYSK